MHVVALTKLAVSAAPGSSASSGSWVDDEAIALARDLGALAYEQRLKLKQGLPAIVLTTADPRRAAALHAALRARGHEALICRSEQVTATAAMIAMRRFRFDDDGIAIDGARLRWSDIATLVRAVHRVAGRDPSAPRDEETEAVLYVFPRTGGAPWSLREQHASYEALGSDATPSSLHNFELVVDHIRTSARSAAFDDRLASRRGSPDEIDILAHVVATALAADGTSPFR
jgi:hypothetical protein